MNKLARCVFLITFCMIFIQCKSNLIFNNSSRSLSFLEINEGYKYEWKKGITGSADNQISYPLYFEVELPNKLEGLKYYNCNSYNSFKYPGNQYVFIEEALAHNFDLKVAKFKSIDITKEEDLNDYFTTYRKECKIPIIKSNRKTILFNDGFTTIILLNIKKENLNQFLNVIQSFKYKV